MQKHERKRYHVQKDNLKLLLTPKSVDSSLFLFEDGGDVKGIMLQFEGLVWCVWKRECVRVCVCERIIAGKSCCPF